MEEIKEIQKCPACKKTVHEQQCWVQCPYFHYQPICIAHCKTCKYNTSDDFHCSYTQDRKIKKKEYYTVSRVKRVQAQQ